MLLNRSNSYICTPYAALRSQTFGNIHEIFQNICHINLPYILRPALRVLLPHTCLVFQMAHGKVAYHYNRHLMRHFEFLHGSRMIWLPLNFSEKLHWQHLFEKLVEAEDHRCHFFNRIQHPHILKNYIKQTGPTTIDTNPVLGHILVHALTNPSCSCNSGINGVVVLEYTFFQICSNAEQVS